MKVPTFNATAKSTIHCKGSKADAINAHPIEMREFARKLKGSPSFFLISGREREEIEKAASCSRKIDEGTIQRLMNEFSHQFK